MFRYAVIDSGSLTVVNTVIWDGVSQWSPPSGHFVVRDPQAGIGDSYDAQSGTFSRS